MINYADLDGGVLARLSANDNNRIRDTANKTLQCDSRIEPALKASGA